PLGTRSGLTDLVANIGRRSVEEMIERTIGSIENQTLSIPRFIVSVHYFVPGRQFQTIDVRRAAFHPLAMQSQVAANHFDLSDACRSLQSGLSPSDAACEDGIYAVCDNNATELKIFGCQRVSYRVAHRADRVACSPQGLLDSVDTKIRGREPLCQLT